MSKEIERKFWLANSPDFLHRTTPQSIQQGYLAVQPDGREVRLRKKEEEYSLTIKSGVGLRRTEYEVDLQPEQFRILWPATEGRRLRKKRYTHPLPTGWLLEVDVYEEPLAGLVIGEIEFPDEDAAQSFSPPDWLGREVTEYSFFKNKNLLQFSTIDELKQQL